MAIESVMLSSIIDAKERRDIATVDIPGAFWQADMEYKIHMKLEGKMDELLVRINPKLFRKHVQVERGEQVLSVELESTLRNGEAATPTAGQLFETNGTDTIPLGEE